MPTVEENSSVIILERWDPMKRKALSILLVLAIAFSASVPVFAANYSDLQGHWAKEYMESLADKGYLTGYSDGTMKPDKSITACEALALLSRFYSPGEAAVELIQSDYGVFVEGTVPSTLSWAYDELSVCLAAGIITEDELKSLNLAAEIKKERLAVFIVRAMQLQSEAASLENNELSFKDKDQIAAGTKGSIALLVSAGIVKGDNDNNFSPQLSVTRAVVAAMISRSLSYLDTRGKTLAIEKYKDVARAEGVLSSASGTGLLLSCFDGFTREFVIPSGARVTVNGTVKMLSTAYVGCYAEVTRSGGTVTLVAVKSESAVNWVQGVIANVVSSSETTTKYLYISPLSGGSSTKYLITDSAAITKDGKAAAFASLEYGGFVTLKVKDSIVTEVRATSGDAELTGQIQAISLGTTVTLKIKDKNGFLCTFLLDIANLPKIQRGSAAIGIDRLNIGDEITVTLADCKVSTISAVGTENTLTGELTSVIESTSGYQWIIKQDNGESVTLSVDESAGVYHGTTAILLSDIHAGDRVSVVVVGSTITEISLLSAVTSADKVSGSVLVVNATSKTVTILTASGKLVYLDLKAVVSIISAETGRAVSLSSLAVNSRIVAYGSYSNSSTFKAVSIIVES
jgi:hypothetical protein